MSKLQRFHELEAIAMVWLIDAKEIKNHSTGLTCVRCKRCTVPDDYLCNILLSHTQLRFLTPITIFISFFVAKYTASNCFESLADMGNWLVNGETVF